jgi:uncharacterized protein YjbI with pentapeptide repeats
MPDHKEESSAATDAYRERMFVGIGESTHEALVNAFDLAKAAGYEAGTPVAQRFTAPNTNWANQDWRDADWRDADWRDADWRDADWRDADWRDADWRTTQLHTVIVHAHKARS